MMGKFENRDEVPHTTNSITYVNEIVQCRILLDLIVPLVNVAKIIFEYVDHTIKFKIILVELLFHDFFNYNTAEFNW